MFSNYDNNIEKLHKAGYQPDNLYLFFTDDKAGLFQEFFDFVDYDVNEDYKGYNFRPFIFAFRNDSEPNVYTCRKNGSSILTISKGLIRKFHKQLENKEQLFASFPSANLSGLAPHLTGAATVKLVYDLGLKFAYFHAVAHLMQLEGTSTTPKQEKRTQLTTSEYSLHHHAMEFDADLYASTYIAFELMEIELKLQQPDHTSQTLEALLSLAMSSILLVFQCMNGKTMPVYYEAHTHPHELIRISYITRRTLSVLEGIVHNTTLPSADTVLYNSFRIAAAVLEENKDISLKALLKTCDIEVPLLEHYMEKMNNVLHYTHKIASI